MGGNLETRDAPAAEAASKSKSTPAQSLNTQTGNRGTPASVESAQQATVAAALTDTVKVEKSSSDSEITMPQLSAREFDKLHPTERALLASITSDLKNPDRALIISTMLFGTDAAVGLLEMVNRIPGVTNDLQAGKLSAAARADFEKKLTEMEKEAQGIVPRDLLLDLRRISDGCSPEPGYDTNKWAWKSLLGWKARLQDTEPPPVAAAVPEVRAEMAPAKRAVESAQAELAVAPKEELKEKPVPAAAQLAEKPIGKPDFDCPKLATPPALDKTAPVEAAPEKPAEIAAVEEVRTQKPAEEKSAADSASPQVFDAPQLASPPPLQAQAAPLREEPIEQPPSRAGSEADYEQIPVADCPPAASDQPAALEQQELVAESGPREEHRLYEGGSVPAERMERASYRSDEPEYLRYKFEGERAPANDPPIIAAMRHQPAEKPVDMPAARTEKSAASEAGVQAPHIQSSKERKNYVQEHYGKEVAFIAKRFNITRNGEKEAFMSRISPELRRDVLEAASILKKGTFSDRDFEIPKAMASAARGKVRL